MTKVSGLIFDMDGTLVDSSADIAASLNHALKTLGLAPKTQEEVHSFIGDGMKTLLERATGSKDEALIAQAVSIFRPYYLEHCVNATVLYPNTREVLDHFQGKTIALVSNKPYEMVLKILDHFGIRNRFQVVLGGESTKERKPHPEPILKSIAGMGTAPETTLVIGDGTTDIQAGKSAGALTCAVTYGYRKFEELSPCKPDFFIDRIEDLKSIVH